jgi:hypothetical protein
MATVTVFRFTVYDVTTDENRLSRRMATCEAVNLARGHAIEDTAREVDASAVGREIAGMTDRDFWSWVNSGLSGGRQRAVMR